MNEAVNMSDKFLQKGQIVVSQRGRAFPDQVYRATRGEEGSKFPIVVLVNRNTASAAEIVSGALQDHDRALIVGETTFGKGLVQTVFQITENTGLALTTYHYYTPSGRLIQRSYDHVSLYDYYYVRNDDAKAKDKSNLEVKLTDSGRTVYGGGGITPDEKIDNLKSNHFQDSLLIHYAFFNFSKHYLANPTPSPKTSRSTILSCSSSKSFLKDNQIDYTDADIAGVNGLDQGEHQERALHFAVRSTRRPQSPRRMGPADRQGSHLPARGPDPRRPLQAGPEDQHRQRQTLIVHNSSFVAQTMALKSKLERHSVSRNHNDFETIRRPAAHKLTTSPPES